MKYIPAILFALLAVGFLIASRAGDNVDALALAGILIFPSATCAALAAICALVARVL